MSSLAIRQCCRERKAMAPALAEMSRKLLMSKHEDLVEDVDSN